MLGDYGSIDGGAEIGSAASVCNVELLLVGQLMGERRRTFGEWCFF
jgi:hypothetical protein